MYLAVVLLLGFSYITHFCCKSMWSKTSPLKSNAYYFERYLACNKSNWHYIPSL